MIPSVDKDMKQLELSCSAKLLKINTMTLENLQCLLKMNNDVPYDCAFLLDVYLKLWECL